MKIKLLNVLLITTCLASSGAYTEVMASSIDGAALSGQTEQGTQLHQWYLTGELNTVLDALNTDQELREMMAKPAGVTEGYTVLEHTQRVIQRFVLLRSKISLPDEISEKDMALFLALHDSAKALAREKMESEVRATAYNKKTWESYLSKCEFEKAADSAGMPSKSMRILGTLLESDTTGDYFKGILPVEIAFKFYVRDAAKAGITLRAFYDLHVNFHKIDAGSYPTLQALFAGDDVLDYSDTNKMQPLATLIDSYEKSEEYIKTGEFEKDLKECLTALERLKQRAKEGEPREKLWDEECALSAELDKKVSGAKIGSYMHSLRLKEYYGRNSEMVDQINTAKEHIDALREHRFNLRSTPTDAIKVYLQECGGDRQAIFHGANSHVLIGLRDTSATLMPLGILFNYGITPLSGELREGSTGVNSQNLSVSYQRDYRRSLYEYASSFHISVESVNSSVNTGLILLQEHKNKKHLPLQDDVPAEVEGTPEESYAYTLDDRFFARRPHIERGTSGLPSNLRRLKLFFPEEFEEVKQKLTPLLEWEKNTLKAYQNTKFYKKRMPTELGGEWHDYYYYNIAKARTRWIESCFDALNFEQKNQLGGVELSRMVAEKPFPIIFQSNAPCSLPSCSRSYEGRFNGFLRIGHEVNRVIVPEDKLESVRMWVRSNALPDATVEIVALESFSANKKASDDSDDDDI